LKQRIWARGFTSLTCGEQGSISISWFVIGEGTALIRLLDSGVARGRRAEPTPGSKRDHSADLFLARP